MFYWFMKYVVIGPIVKAIFRPWIVGRSNVPASGAAILASNHLSVSDSIFLPLMIDRPMSFLAKSDYFTGKGLKGWATRMFMKATGQIPIDRTGGKASEDSLNTGLQVLGRGDLLRDADLLPAVRDAAQTLLERWPQHVSPLLERWLRHGQQYGQV